MSKKKLLARIALKIRANKLLLEENIDCDQEYYKGKIKALEEIIYFINNE